MRWLLILLVATAACTDADDFDDVDTEMIEETLTGSGDTTIIQVNIFKGGSFDRFPNQGPGSYGIARRFARMIDKRYRRASVIAMQEVTSAANADKLRAILEEETGKPWRVQHFGTATYADALPVVSHQAVFWRGDVHELVENFGTRQVEVVDTSAGPLTQSLRFGGLLLRRLGTQRTLAVFTGKLAPLTYERAGRRLTNADRAKEVARLHAWIENKLAAHPGATRVIGIDTNADYGTRPWRELRRHYWDDGDDRPTHHTYGARRIDYLWWDADAGPRRTDGFVLGPYVSPDFGSDHRAVIARVRVGK